MFLAQDHWLNVVEVLRDEASRFRSIIESPLRADEKWHHFNWHVYKKLVAFGKLLQCSDRLRARFAAAQQIGFKKDNREGGDLEPRVFLLQRNQDGFVNGSK